MVGLKSTSRDTAPRKGDCLTVGGVRIFIFTPLLGHIFHIHANI